jgi:hypothetical protein
MAHVPKEHEHWGWAGLDIAKLTTQEIRASVTEAEARLSMPAGWAGYIYVYCPIDCDVVLELSRPPLRGRHLRIRFQCAESVSVHASLTSSARRPTPTDPWQRLELSASLEDSEGRDLTGTARARFRFDALTAAAVASVSADSVTVEVLHPSVWTVDARPEKIIYRNGAIEFDPEPLETRTLSAVNFRSLVTTAGAVVGLAASLIAVILFGFYSRFGVSLADVGIDAQALSARALAVGTLPIAVSASVQLTLGIQRGPRWRRFYQFRVTLGILVGICILQVMISRAVPESASLTHLQSLAMVLFSVAILLITIAIVADRDLHRRAGGLTAIAVVVSVTGALTTAYILAARLPVDIETAHGPETIAVRFFPGVPLIDVRLVEVTLTSTDATTAVQSNHLSIDGDPSSDSSAPAPPDKPITFCMGLMGSGGGVYTFITQATVSNGQPNQILRIPVDQGVVRYDLPNTDSVDDVCEAGHLVQR